MAGPVSREEVEHGVAVWSSEDWIRRAIVWVDERLAEAGLDRTGDPGSAACAPGRPCSGFPRRAGSSRSSSRGRVGKIARALTWHRSVSAFSPDEADENWLSGPSESLFSLLEDSWLGRA